MGGVKVIVGICESVSIQSHYFNIELHEFYLKVLEMGFGGLKAQTGGYWDWGKGVFGPMTPLLSTPFNGCESFRVVTFSGGDLRASVKANMEAVCVLHGNGLSGCDRPDDRGCP
jgi:hypothetical protein